MAGKNDLTQQIKNSVSLRQINIIFKLKEWLVNFHVILVLLYKWFLKKEYIGKKVLAWRSTNKGKYLKMEVRETQSSLFSSTQNTKFPWGYLRSSSTQLKELGFKNHSFSTSKINIYLRPQGRILIVLVGSSAILMDVKKECTLFTRNQNFVLKSILSPILQRAFWDLTVSALRCFEVSHN